MNESERRFHLSQLTLRVVIATIVVTVGHSTFFSDVNQYYRRAQDLSLHHLPYKDFLWEYPPFAASPLALIPLLARNHAAFLVAFVVLMIAIEYCCLLLLRHARPGQRDQIARFWLLSVVPLSAIGWFRLDFLAVLCAAFAVIAIVEKRRYVVATFVGFGMKLWPLVFGIAMVLQRRWRDAFITGVAAALLLGAWYAFSPEGFRTFLDFRSGNGFQIESIPGSILLFFGRAPHLRFGAVIVLDDGFGWLQILLQVLFVVIPLSALAVAWNRKAVDLIALLGALVCVMLLSTRLLSPQFLLWLAPFIAMLLPQMRRAVWIYIVAAWLTVLNIQLYEFYVFGNPAVILLMIVRNGLLVWLAVELFRLAFKSQVQASKAPSS